MGLQAYLPRLKDLENFYAGLSLITAHTHRELRHFLSASQRWNNCGLYVRFSASGTYRLLCSLSLDVGWLFDLLMFHWAFLKEIQLIHCDVSKINNFVYNAEQHLITAGAVCSQFVCAARWILSTISLCFSAIKTLVLYTIFNIFRAYSLVGLCVDCITRI